jgi:hypothetical protein
MCTVILKAKIMVIIIIVTAVETSNLTKIMVFVQIVLILLWYKIVQGLEICFLFVFAQLLIEGLSVKLYLRQLSNGLNYFVHVQWSAFTPQGWNLLETVSSLKALRPWPSEFIINIIIIINKGCHIVSVSHIVNSIYNIPLGIFEKGVVRGFMPLSLIIDIFPVLKLSLNVKMMQCGTCRCLVLYVEMWQSRRTSIKSEHNRERRPQICSLWYLHCSLAQTI